MVSTVLIETGHCLRALGRLDEAAAAYEAMSMSVWVPESFAVSSDDHTYPVVFINGSHGREFFATLVGIVKLLGERERMPESIVVSLDDGGAIPEVFTHGMWSRREKLGGSADPRTSLRHLEEEVIPYLEANYRANAAGEMRRRVDNP